MDVDMINNSLGYTPPEAAAPQKREIREPGKPTHAREIKEPGKPAVPADADLGGASRKEDEVSNSVLEKAVADANAKLGAYSRSLEVSVHEKTRRIMVKVVNTETNEVIREIPPESALDTFAKVMELAGLLVDKKN